MHVLYWTLATLTILIAMAAAGHALLYKRDPRAALGWIAVCLLYPLVGPILYFLFGINRVRTRAKNSTGTGSFRFISAMNARKMKM